MYIFDTFYFLCFFSYQDEFAAPSGRVKVRKERKDETTTDEFIDEKLSKQILTQARLQMQDLQTETGPTKVVKSVKLPKLGENLSGDEGDSDNEGLDDDDKAFNDEVTRNYKMNKRDEEAFEAFQFNSGRFST